MRTSSNYITTLDPLSAVDMEKLQLIRDAVSAANVNRLRKKYVKLHARGPRIQAAISDNASIFAYQRELPVRHAQRLDVYIYDRSL
jgi:hypothetical protein